MAIVPRLVHYGTIGGDELLDIGAKLENRLAAIGAELDALEPIVIAERGRIRRSGMKLAINTTLGLAGAAAAPITFGWSLLLTLGCAGMVVWDGLDYANDYIGYSPDRRRLRELRREASEAFDELTVIHAVLETRYRR
ncbi:MAG TPA: hypothetical protein VKI44_43045 [Acetobacteraceae bacterium]|nr:hypothetical protein [Acetobacteraceae bacterium]